MIAEVTLSSLQAAVLLPECRPPLSPSSPAFFSRSRLTAKSLCSIFSMLGDNLVAREFFRRLCDQPVLLGEVFRGEDIVGRAFLDQEAAAGNLVVGCCTKRSHLRSPSEMYLVWFGSA